MRARPVFSLHFLSSFGELPWDYTNHSPIVSFADIGTCHVEEDMALVLDAANYRYPCHW